MASGSATFSGSYGSHFRLEVNYGLVSQNISANTSVVRVWVNLVSDGYGSMYGVTSPLTLQINGGSGIQNVGININTNSAVTLFSRDYTIGHNADGSKTMNVYAKLSINGYGYGEAAWGTNYTLPTIPRASTSSDIKGTLNSPLTINISRASGSFTHTVKYNFGSLNGTIATSVATSVTWTPPLSLATAMPVKTTDWGNFTIDTYNGGTKIGSKTYKMTLTIPDSVKPTLGSITLTDTNTIAKNLLNTSNMFVQNQSNVKVTFNSASGNTGSSIKEYHAQIVNKGNISTGNNGLLGLMNYSGTATVEAWVVDSRGRSSSKVTQQISVLSYASPALYFTATRGNDTASSNKVIVSRTATISRLLVNSVQKNTFKLEFAYSAYNVTTHTTDNGANIAKTTGTYSITRSNATMNATFDVGKSYKIYGRLTDAFSSTPWIEYEIHPETMVMGMAKTTVSFGKYPELPNSVDSMWPYYYNNKPIQHHQLTRDDGRSPYNASGTVDLNTKTVNSFFSCNEPTNGPTVGTGLNQFYVSVYSESDSYLSQQAIQKNSGRMFTRTRHDGNWTNWIEYAPLNSIAEFTAVNQTKIYSATLAGPYGMSLQARRVGNLVSVTLDAPITSKESRHGTAKETIPTGWRPVKTEHIVSPGFAGGGTGTQMWTGESLCHLIYKSDGSIGFTIRATATPLSVFASVTWITTDPFPSE